MYPRGPRPVGVPGPGQGHPAGTPTRRPAGAAAGPAGRAAPATAYYDDAGWPWPSAWPPTPRSRAHGASVGQGLRRRPGGRRRREAGELRLLGVPRPSGRWVQPPATAPRRSGTAAGRMPWRWLDNRHADAARPIRAVPGPGSPRWPPRPRCGVIPVPPAREATIPHRQSPPAASPESPSARRAGADHRTRLLIDSAPFAASLTASPPTGPRCLPTAKPTGWAWLKELDPFPQVDLDDDAYVAAIAKLGGLVDLSNESVTDNSINLLPAWAWCCATP